MNEAVLRFEPTENPLENGDRRVGRLAWFIENAGEPKSLIGPN